MTSPKRAICHAAIAVAEAYGPNVSKGILAMEARIVELEARVRDVERDIVIAKGM